MEPPASLSARPESPRDSPEVIAARLQEVIGALNERQTTHNELEQAKARIAELEQHAAELRERRKTAQPSPSEPAPRVAAITDDPVAPAEPKTPWTRLPSRAGQFSRIGQTLLERGLVDEDALERALVRQRETGRRLGETLVELGVISSFDLANVLADQLGVPFIDMRTHPPDMLLATLIPEEVARRCRALPVARWSGQLVVAMASPNDVFALDDLRVLTGESIIAALADYEQLDAALDRAYQHSVDNMLDDASNDYATDAGDDDLDVDVEDGPVVRLVAGLLDEAIQRGASDLHVEPSSDGVNLRFRVDGVLHDSSEAPLAILRPLVSRLKVLAGIDIAQSRIPQDGRFSIPVKGRRVDIRVATMPTTSGESVVLRLLDPIRGVRDLSALGLSDNELARFEPAFRASQGAVFVCGPTGSGKTSTLYTVLKEISTRDTSIVSVEDPVEYRLDGIKQVQINTRAGLTFPIALRSILRADPDVVMVGEVRDAETAQIAAEASITGHLVFSTLHTTRAAAAPLRLVKMGVESYMVASALTCVVAQRLARRLCDNCAEPEPAPDIDLLRRLGASDAQLDRSAIRRAVGCPACIGTGYRGRRPVYEVMPITESIERLLLTDTSATQIERVAVEEGMRTLRAAALDFVVNGDMSIEEMLRTIP